MFTVNTSTYINENVIIDINNKDDILELQDYIDIRHNLCIKNLNPKITKNWTSWNRWNHSNINYEISLIKDLHFFNSIYNNLKTVTAFHFEQLYNRYHDNRDDRPIKEFIELDVERFHYIENKNMKQNKELIYALFKEDLLFKVEFLDKIIATEKNRLTIPYCSYFEPTVIKNIRSNKSKVRAISLLNYFDKDIIQSIKLSILGMF